MDLLRRGRMRPNPGNELGYGSGGNVGEGNGQQYGFGVGPNGVDNKSDEDDDDIGPPPAQVNGLKTGIPHLADHQEPQKAYDAKPGHAPRPVRNRPLEAMDQSGNQSCAGGNGKAFLCPR